MKDEWQPLGPTSDLEINTITSETRRIIYN